MLQLLAETVLKEFRIKSAGPVGLDEMDDAAVLDPGEGRLVFTTDSHTVKPLFFPGGDIGRLAVAGTVNDLAVMGARPVAMACAVVVQEGFEVERFKAIVRSMGRTAEEAGVALVTGDFKVMGRGELDGVVITTTGIGIAREFKTDSMLAPGDKIIITGTLGDHGATILAQREGFAVSEELVSDVCPVWDVVEAALSVGGVSAMKDPTRGGLAAALNELASKSGVGVVLEESALPVRPVVRSFCDMLGLDLLTLTNEGKVVMGVRPDRADEVLRAIRRNPKAKDARIIGEATAEHRGKVIVRTVVGGHRVLPPPVGDPVPRIC
jgi:hydrogenase expression/formation protein HypE